MIKILFSKIHSMSYRMHDLYAWYLSKIIASCGPNLKIWGKIAIKNPKNLTFGKNVAINDGVYINAYAPILIGDNVAISAGVIIVSTGLDKYIFPTKMEHIAKEIIINSNVQIGAGAIILPGVTIGPNVIVGAGAVVTKNIAGNIIVGGIPAKVISRISSGKEQLSD